MQAVLKRLLFSLPIALISAAIGYFLLPWLGLIQPNPSTLFAAGIGLGILIGGTLIPSSGHSGSRQAAKPSKKSAPVNNNEDSERKTVFIGNLAYRASPRQLRELFEAHGTVHSVRIATDRESRKPRGFGFIEMNASGADQAIQALHGSELCDRELNLSEAKQRVNNP